MGERKYCGDSNPSHQYGCTRSYGHSGLHQAMSGEQWEQTPAVPAQIADARTLAAHEREMPGTGFTREGLTAAAARQQKVAPSKDEILAAIRNLADLTGTFAADRHNAVLLKARQAVEKLYADRGL